MSYSPSSARYLSDARVACENAYSREISPEATFTLPERTSFPLFSGASMVTEEASEERVAQLQSTSSAFHSADEETENLYSPPRQPNSKDSEAVVFRYGTSPDSCATLMVIGSTASESNFTTTSAERYSSVSLAVTLTTIASADISAVHQSSAELSTDETASSPTRVTVTGFSDAVWSKISRSADIKA